MMNDNKGLSRTILKSIIHHNPVTYIMVVCVAAFVFIPMVLLNSSKSILNSVKEAVSEVYGGFDYIYYSDLDSVQNDPKEYYSKIESNSDVQAIGKLEISGIIADSEYVLHAGYADVNAIRQSGINLISGRMPEKPGEVAVTESSLPYVDDIRNNLGFSTEVVGVVADYGRLWPRGKKQNDSSLDNIDIILCKTDMEALREKTGINICILLIDTGYSRSIGDIEELYENNNWKNANYQNSSYDIPESFILICCGICTFLLIGTMMFCNNYIRRKYYIIWMLGAEQSRIRKHINHELGLYLIIGNILGIIAGMAGSFIALIILSGRLEKHISLTPDVVHILEVVLANVIIVFVVGNILFRTKSRKDEGGHTHHKARKTGLMRMAFLEYCSFPKAFIVTFLVIVISISSIIYVNSYLKEFSSKTVYAGGYDGEMPMDYDFELIAKGKEFEGIEDGDISYISTYEKNGISAQELNLFGEIEGIRRVNAYKVTDKILIIKDEETFDEYIDISDTYRDGKYSINTLGRQRYISGHDELMRIVGYQDNTIIQTVITGYPDSDIDYFKEYVTEGEINIDKINSGEEIILVVPACIYEEYGGGQDGETPSRAIDYTDYTDKNALNDTLFSVGDEITISEYRVKAEINSGISQEEAESLIERNDNTVRVGAIIRSNTGWFDKDDETQFKTPTYMIITSIEAFDMLDLDSTYTRVRIFAEEGADMGMLQNRLNELASEYPSMELRDMSSQLVSYHELNILVSISCEFIKYLVIVFGCLSVGLQMITKTKSNRGYYRLLRINGMSFLDVILLLVVQTIITIVISLAILCVLCFIFIVPENIALLTGSISTIWWYLLIIFSGTVAGSALIISFG